MTVHGAEVQELIKRIRASVDERDPSKGKFKVAKSGQKHYKVLHANGSSVVDENGPLIISSSPSDMRWREMTVKRLMASKVLKSDPYKETRGRAEDASEAPELTEQEKAEEKRKAAQRMALRDRSEGFRLRTGRLRARIEPIISRLGGWSRGGSGVKVSDFIVILERWARAEAPELIPTGSGGIGEVPASAWTGAVNNLRTPDGTLSEKWLPLFEGFADRLERDAGSPPEPSESALIYLDMVRESKGIGVAPPAPAEDEEAATADSFRMTLSAVAFRVPKVAVEALFWMARGASADDHDTILELFEQIAAMEAADEGRET
jgi:hypothetical protein